jgi:hypothetical protein
LPAAGDQSLAVRSNTTDGAVKRTGPSEVDVLYCASAAVPAAARAWPCRARMPRPPPRRQPVDDGGVRRQPGRRQGLADRLVLVEQQVGS